MKNDDRRTNEHSYFHGALGPKEISSCRLLNPSLSLSKTISVSYSVGTTSKEYVLRHHYPYYPVVIWTVFRFARKAVPQDRIRAVVLHTILDWQRWAYDWQPLLWWPKTRYCWKETLVRKPERCKIILTLLAMSHITARGSKSKDMWKVIQWHIRWLEWKRLHWTFSGLRGISALRRKGCRSTYADLSAAIFNGD